MDFNAILQPLQTAFIAWVNQYQFTTTYSTFCELTNCEFFLHMLQRVYKFRLIEPIEWNNFLGLQTGQKIKRMRIVGRSVANYYKNQMNVSVDNLAFNYLQMCMENGSPEILKLVIAIVGILVQNVQIKAQLQQFLAQLQEQKATLFKIMIEYASKIGDKIADNADSPIKRQKNLVSKLESLQEELQFYEDYALKLQNKIELLNGDVIRYKIKSVELKEGGDKLLKKVENLETLNQEITKQLQTKTRQQEILNERLTLNRQSAQQILDRLLAENEKERSDANYLRKQLADKHAFEVQNRKYKKMLEQKEDTIQELKIKLQKYCQTIGNYEAEMKKLNKSIENLQTENQDLKLKVQLLQKSYPTNKTYYCSPDQQSIVVATNLGDSYLQGTPKQWFGAQQDFNNTRLNNSQQSLSYSMRSVNSNDFPFNKGYFSIRQLQNSSIELQQDKQNRNPNIVQNIKLSEVQEEKSMEVSQSCLRENIMSSQLQLAISTIFELYSSLQMSRREVRSFQQKQAQRAKRTVSFASKVQKMFA